jgi:serine/threonine protein kinase
MSSSALNRGLTTQSENALNLTYLRLLRVSSEAPHEDLLAFLSLVQSCEVDILPVMWYPALKVGRGGFAVLNGSPVNEEFGFVFKRLANVENRPGEDFKSFGSIMTELAILMHHNVRRHANVVDLYGICWEVNPEEGRILPVLVLERARIGDLLQLRDAKEGRNMSVETKLSICCQVAKGLAMLHASRRLIPHS